MLARIKKLRLSLWLKQQLDKRKRYKELRKIAKQEKLWDMRLKGER